MTAQHANADESETLVYLESFIKSYLSDKVVRLRFKIFAKPSLDIHRYSDVLLEYETLLPRNCEFVVGAISKSTEDFSGHGSTLFEIELFEKDLLDE